MKCQYCRNEFVEDRYGNCSKCGGHASKDTYHKASLLYENGYISGAEFGDSYSLPSGSSYNVPEYVANIPYSMEGKWINELWVFKRRMDNDISILFQRSTESRDYCGQLRIRIEKLEKELQLACSIIGILLVTFFIILIIR